MNRHQLILVCLLVVPFLLASCGGKGGEGIPDHGGNVTFTFAWPSAAFTHDERSVSSVKSLRVTLGGQSQTLVTPNSSVTFSGMAVGTIMFSVRAFSSTDATGMSLAETQGAVTVQDHQDTQESISSDTNGISQLAIGQLSINPHPSLLVGATLPLAIGAVSIDSKFVLVDMNLFSITSSDPTVASVDVNGTVTALKKGTATISATYGVFNAVAQIIVTTDTKVTIVPPPVLTLGQTATLQVLVTGSTTDKQVTWIVQEQNGGTIDPQSGSYTAPQNAGTYHIIATSVVDADATDTVAITVQATDTTVIIH